MSGGIGRRSGKSGNGETATGTIHDPAPPRPERRPASESGPTRPFPARPEPSGRQRGGPSRSSTDRSSHAVGMSSGVTFRRRSVSRYSAPWAGAARYTYPRSAPTIEYADTARRAFVAIRSVVRCSGGCWKFRSRTPLSALRPSPDLAPATRRALRSRYNGGPSSCDHGRISRRTRCGRPVFRPLPAGTAVNFLRGGGPAERLPRARLACGFDRLRDVRGVAAAPPEQTRCLKLRHRRKAVRTLDRCGFTAGDFRLTRVEITCCHPRAAGRHEVPRRRRHWIVLPNQLVLSSPEAASRRAITASRGPRENAERRTAKRGRLSPRSHRPPRAGVYGFGVLVIRPWPVTYWKTLPVGYRLSFFVELAGRLIGRMPRGLGAKFMAGAVSGRRSMHAASQRSRRSGVVRHGVCRSKSGSHDG